MRWIYLFGVTLIVCGAGIWKVNRQITQEKKVLQHVDAVLNRAAARGKYLRQDVIEIRRELERAGQPKIAQEAIRRISVGLNQNRLHPEDSRYVFPNSLF
jgi:hypothetical protein